MAISENHAISVQRKTGSLLQKEMQEYQGSLFRTPLIIAAVLVILMLLSVILANRIAFIGEGLTHILLEEHNRGGLNITISLDDESLETDYVITEELDFPPPPAQDTTAPVLEVQEVPEDAQVMEDDWNFSGEWTFNPSRSGRVKPAGGEEEGSFNVVLNVLHMLFQIILVVVSVNYLLGTLYQDRKDRSILFWKSMPVSEGHEVVVKMAVAALLAPLVFTAVSIVTQLAYVLLAMLLVWRLDGDPAGVVLGNVDFVPLFVHQLGSILVWILWSAPIYGWLLFSSALSRRSPFMLAFGVPIVCVLLEMAFLGTEQLSSSIANHLPQIAADESGPAISYAAASTWAQLDYTGMLIGLAMCAGFLTAAAWLRKNRFEI
jgi:ABC-2 type transport system permease protein